jgi:hypothetical protein
MSTTHRRFWAAAVLAVVAIALQFTSASHTNPPFDPSQSLERTTAVPAAVAQALSVACNDCHSNETKWPWYTHVAPISWLTVGHVNDGRAELNFSEWGTYGVRMRETRRRAICELSRTGAMPLPAYTVAHPAAKLSPDQIESICRWATQPLAARSLD